MSEHAYSSGSVRPRAVAVGGAVDRAANPLGALAVAGACVLALAVIWSVAQLVPAVHLKDAVALYEFTTLSRPRVDSLAKFLLHLLDPALFILWAISLVAFAISRGRPREALAVIVVLAAAPLTAEELKPLLAHQHDSVGYVHINAASWPSGHSTAAAALALCAVLVAPPRLRTLVAVLGAAFVLAVGVALLILAWHMPSDVLGGYLVAALWMALAVAGLRLAERRRPSRRDGSPEPAPPAA